MKKKPPVAAKPAHLTLQSSRAHSCAKQKSTELRVSNSFSQERSNIIKKLDRFYASRQRQDPAQHVDHKLPADLSSLRLYSSAPDVYRRCEPFCADRSATTSVVGTETYVQINCPAVKPGTMFRLNNHGTLRCRWSADASAVVVEENNNTLINKRSQIDSCGGESEQARNETPSTPQGEAQVVDDGGYEVPIAFNKDIYMSLDDDFGSSADESDNDGYHVGLNRGQRSKKLAKRKEQHYRTAPSSFLRTCARQAAEFKTDQERDVVDGPTPNNTVVQRAGMPVRHLDSFLSSRLREFNDTTRKLGDQLSATNYGHPTTSSSSDEWSSCSSDDCSSCADFYEEIAPPPSPDVLDHDYEIIDENAFRSLPKKPCKHHRKRNVTKAVATAVGIVKKDKSPQHTSRGSTSPNSDAHRKQLREIRAMHESECTWDTVATPGVLKLESFRNLREAIQQRNSAGVC